MTQRELTLNKYVGRTYREHEAVQDAIHDAMKEHAIRFGEWLEGQSRIKETQMGIVTQYSPITYDQLYNIFNLNKESKTKT